MKQGNYHRNEVFAKYVDFPKDRECVSPSHFQLFFEESLWEGESEEGGWLIGVMGGFFFVSSKILCLCCPFFHLAKFFSFFQNR